jgi:hypothetical protein
MYGVSPQDVVSDVERLRPGQRLQLGLPDYARVSASAATRALANLSGPTAAVRGFGGHREAIPEEGWLDKPLAETFPQITDFLQGLGRVTGAEDYPIPPEKSYSQALAEPVPGDFSGHVAAQTYALEDHLARQAEWVQEQGEAEQWDRIQFATGMRYTGQALAYVYEEMINGNPNWQDILFVQSGPFEGNALILTDKMLMAFSPDQREKIWEMGYALTDDGYWAPQKIEEEGYGMGGYSYPGYGGGYGIGGGDWEPTPRGGTYARVHGGGKTTKDVRKLFAASTPPSHWRI